MPARSPPPIEMSRSRLVKLPGSLDAPRKGAEARRLEHLQREDRRNAYGDVAEALGACHRNEHLLQIDAGLASAEDARAAAALRHGPRDGWIGRVHPAVAVHRHRDGIEPGIAFETPVAGDVGDEEPVEIALHLACRRKSGRARADHLAPRTEERGGDIQLAVGMYDAGRIEGCRRRIAAVGCARARQRLLPRTVAFLEIAFRGAAGSGPQTEAQRGNGAAENRTRDPLLHLTPPNALVLASRRQ